MQPENGRIRLFLKYDTLFVADLRALLFDVERSYNQLTAAEQGTSRIRLAQRLQVSVATTEKSFEVVLFGALAGVLAFAEIVRRLSNARNEFWQSEKTKWEAKTLKSEFEKRERAGDYVSPPERRRYAEAILTDRFFETNTSRRLRLM